MPSLRLVCRRFGTHRCVYCDEPASTVDHIIPRRVTKRKRRPAWLPSISDPANLAPACAACNSRKGGQDVRAFLADDPTRLARLVRKMARLNPGAIEMLPMGEPIHETTDAQG